MTKRGESHRLLMACDVVLQVIFLPREALVHRLQLRRFVLLSRGVVRQCSASSRALECHASLTVWPGSCCSVGQPCTTSHDMRAHPVGDVLAQLLDPLRHLPLLLHVRAQPLQLLHRLRQLLLHL